MKFTFPFIQIHKWICNIHKNNFGMNYLWICNNYECGNNFFTVDFNFFKFI